MPRREIPALKNINTAIIALSTIVGGLVIIGLRRAHLPQISDRLE